MPNTPAQKQAISSVIARNTIADTRTLRSAARMYAEIVIILTNTAGYGNIIRLLETDSIPIIVFNNAIFDDRAKSSI